MTEEEATEDFNRWMEEANREASKPNPCINYLQTQAAIRGLRWSPEQKDFAAAHLLAMTPKLIRGRIALQGAPAKLSLWKKTKMIVNHARIILAGKASVEEYEDDDT